MSSKNSSRNGTGGSRRRKAAPVEADPPKVAKKSKLSIRKSNAVEPKLPDPRNTVAGMVMVCGQGDVGQLGLGPDVMERKRFSLIPDLKNVVDICAGGMHTVCLTDDGTVLTFGCDDDGALGRRATDDDSFTPLKVELEGPAVQISAGDSHSAALLPDGRVFAWGSFRDSHGPMGLTSLDAARTPTLIKLNEPVVKLASGADHLIMLTSSGQLFSCGCPEQGQLGRVPARSASRETTRAGLNSFLVPKPLTFSKKVSFSAIWAITYGTFAVDKKKGVFVCGLNNYHQLGLPEEAPVYQPRLSALANTNSVWTKVDGGEHHTLLLNDEGKVYTIGRKEYGRLGLGEGTDDALELTPVPKLADKKCVDIACGSSVSFAVTEDGECYGWGMGTNHQLGAGDVEEDVWEPQVARGLQLDSKKTLRVSAGGQHTVLLVTKPETS